MNSPWVCPGCHAAQSSAYCPACGERAVDPRDLTLRGFAEQALLAVSSIDSRLLRSFRYLLARPGVLTAAYVAGQRKPFLLPLQLFLVANLAFFAVQSLTTANVFSTPLDLHLHDQMWSELARTMTTRHLEAAETSLEAYAPVDRAVLLHAKSLIILMVLGFWPLPALLFRGSRRPFVAHIVFSLHYFAFLLAAFCVALLAAEASVLLGGRGLSSPDFDHALSLGLMGVCAVYLWLAVGKVYGVRGPARTLKATALTAGTALLVLGYRFVLLPITLLTT